MAASILWMAIAADLHQVRLAAAALQGVLRAVTCDEGQASMIELCVVEAVNNAIEHAYAADPSGRIELELSIDKDRLEVRVSDTGHPMPATALATARAGLQEEPGPPREGGYGLGLILEIMSEVRYGSSDNRNTLTMTTTLRRSPA